MTGVVRTLLLTVATALTLPALLTGCDDAAPVPEPEAACVAQDRLDHGSLADGTALWIRSCPVTGPYRREAAFLPTTVLTEGAAELVAGWRDELLPGDEKQFGCSDVTGGITAYRFQIGYADGTVGSILGTTDGCPDRTNAEEQIGTDTFYDVADALARQITDPDFTALGPVIECGDPTPPAARPVTSDDAPVVVSHLGNFVHVCTYEGDTPRERTLGPKPAEELRLLLMGKVDRPGGASTRYPRTEPPPRVVAQLVDAHHNVQYVSLVGSQHRLSVTLPSTGEWVYLGKAIRVYDLLTGTGV